MKENTKRKIYIAIGVIITLILSFFGFLVLGLAFALVIYLISRRNKEPAEQNPDVRERIENDALNKITYGFLRREYDPAVEESIKNFTLKKLDGKQRQGVAQLAKYYNRSEFQREITNPNHILYDLYTELKSGKELDSNFKLNDYEMSALSANTIEARIVRRQLMSYRYLMSLTLKQNNPIFYYQIGQIAKK